MKMRQRRHDARNAKHYMIMRARTKTIEEFMRFGCLLVNWIYPVPVRVKRESGYESQEWRQCHGKCF